MIKENTEALKNREASFFIEAKINPHNYQNTDKNYTTIVFNAFSENLEKKYEQALSKKIISFLRKEGFQPTDNPLKIQCSIEEIIILEKKVQDEIRKFCRSSDIEIKISFSSEIPKNNFQDIIEKDSVYICSMCQSLSNYHICVITKDIKGQCGIMESSDAELMTGLSPFGPCKKIKIGHAIDKIKGEWVEINKAAEEMSFGRIKRITLYSVSDFPPPLSPLAETAVISDGESEGIIDRSDIETEFCGISYHSALDLCCGRGQIAGITGRARQSKII